MVKAEKKKSHSKNFVVIGGAGYLGRYLVKGLLSAYKDVRITVISRNKSKSLFFNDARVEVTTSLINIRHPYDTLYNLAYDQGVGYKDTKKLAEELVHQLKTHLSQGFAKRLIHVSSIAVHGKTFSEDSVNPNPLRRISTDDPYCYSKGLVEKHLYELAHSQKIPTYIVRSGNIMGPGSVWATKLVTRLIDKQPILGLREEHPSNTTFVGNLVEGLIRLSKEHEIDDAPLRIMNFAEFGDVSWKKWLDPIVDMLQIKPEHWQTDDIKNFQPSLKEDLKQLKREMLRVALPMLAKGKASVKYALKFADLMDAGKVKEKTKVFVNKTSQNGLSTLDVLEYNMAQVYLNRIAFGLENVPQSVSSDLPYDFHTAMESILGWLKFGEFQLIL